MLNRNDSANPADPRNAGKTLAGFTVLSDDSVPPSVSSVFDGGDGRGDACLFVEASLSAYLDGELDPEQGHVIETHMNNCAKCAAQVRAARKVDGLIQREWQQELPLPSSFERRRGVDAILDALPPAPPQPALFAPKRMHTRTRWTRLASGLTGLLVLLGMLWSSYQLGYSHGLRRPRSVSSRPSPAAAALPPPALASAPRAAVPPETSRPVSVP